MQLGILGLSKSGKTTLFNLLTGADEATDKFGHSAAVHLGSATVPDRRLARLRDLYHPKRYTPATVDYVDIPGIQRSSGGSSEQLDFDRLKSMDALVLVVRAFDDEEILHPDDSIDPGRDLTNIELELVLADHALVERRIERLEKARKRGLKPEEGRELDLLTAKILPHLEQELPLRTLELAGDEEKMLRGFTLLSAKPLLIVGNLDEGQLGQVTAESLGLTDRPGTRTILMSAPIEREIAGLPPDEQTEFLAELGLEEPSLERILRESYELLGYISFFTVGEDEVRAWTIRRGTLAREAGGAIHSDIERGFIRAEVVAWDELLERGSESACRDAGTLRLEGKQYLVRDGDVMNFRFNV